MNERRKTIPKIQGLQMPPWVKTKLGYTWKPLLTFVRIVIFWSVSLLLQFVVVIPHIGKEAFYSMTPLDSMAVSSLVFAIIAELVYSWRMLQQRAAAARYLREELCAVLGIYPDAYSKQAVLTGLVKVAHALKAWEQRTKESLRVAGINGLYVYARELALLAFDWEGDQRTGASYLYLFDNRGALSAYHDQEDRDFVLSALDGTWRAFEVATDRLLRHDEKTDDR